MDQEDRELADEYLRNLFRLKEAIQNSDDEQKKHNWEITRISPSRDVYEARVEYNRQKIIDKVRYVLKT